MSLSYRIISIGTFDLHPLWHEHAAARTPHATTTLISAGNHHVLVNPSLPAAALAARLSERSPVPPADIARVFLTSCQADHRRGLVMFEHAQWLVHEPERESALALLREALAEAELSGDDAVVEHIRRDIELVARCQPASDSILPGIDLFPLPGVTPGTCGLLIAQPAETALVCGDAVASIEHIAQGRVLAHCENLQSAQESFTEALEIADVLIPGRDNIAWNRQRMTQPRLV